MLEVDPLDAQPWMAQGLIHFRRGDLAAARPALERALQLGPDHPQADVARRILVELRDER